MRGKGARSVSEPEFQDQPERCPTVEGPPLPRVLPGNVVPVLSSRGKLALYRRAMELHIRGRTRMSEQDLREAIRATARLRPL